MVTLQVPGQRSPPGGQPSLLLLLLLLLPLQLRCHPVLYRSAQVSVVYELD
jgi:hypothetical protein